MIFVIIIAFVWILSIATLLLSLETVNAFHEGRGLPGGNWTFNGNGYPTSLLFFTDSTGRVSGTVYRDPIIGFWDESTHKILFMRLPSQNSATFQVYKSYMFMDSVRWQDILLSDFSRRISDTSSSRWFSSEK
jgi:hypothetical protein